MSHLAPEHFEKIEQLCTEMVAFPPAHFLDENLLSWSKYFGIAPQNLPEYTTQTAKILEIALNLARKAQGLETVLHEDYGYTRSLNPIPSVESFHFLWLQTLLILFPQTDGSLLDKEFSPYFKIACCLKNTEEILEDLKYSAQYHDHPLDICETYNATLVLNDSLESAANTFDVNECTKIYQQIYSLNQGAMDSPAKITLLKSASPELKERFLISIDTPTTPESNEPIGVENHESFEAGIRQKIFDLSQKFSEKELSFFKDLDIKMDETQQQAFVSQIKKFLLKISQGPQNPSPQTLTGSAA